MSPTFFRQEERQGVQIFRLQSEDGTNRLSRQCVLSLTDAICALAVTRRPLVITGNNHFFSAGADLNEIALLSGPSALEFSKVGQNLMRAIEAFPAPVYAAISGYCMGGGLDLGLACHRRIAAPNVVFGHRGAALGLITGWGGTQRLPRLIGKAQALQMFVASEKINAQHALSLGLIDAIAPEPLAESLRQIRSHAES